MRCLTGPPQRASTGSMSSTQQERSDMPLLTADEAQDLLKKVLALSRADECEVSVNASEGGNIRYARNSVSTSGALYSTEVGIASAFGRKQGITTINEFDDASLEKAVRRAETLAHLAPENPEYMPLLGPQTYGPAARTFDPATAAMTSRLRADLTAKSLAIAAESKVTA